MKSFLKRTCLLDRGFYFSLSHVIALFAVLVSTAVNYCRKRSVPAIDLKEIVLSVRKNEHLRTGTFNLPSNRRTNLTNIFLSSLEKPAKNVSTIGYV
jgi:hypothetical protein